MQLLDSDGRGGRGHQAQRAELAHLADLCPTVASSSRTQLQKKALLRHSFEGKGDESGGRQGHCTPSGVAQTEGHALVMSG